MTNSLVSICIPTCNGEKFLSETLHSAINQTYKNLEIIVSDDSSTDKTLHIIESFQRKTNISFHIYKHKPEGIAANWNYCIEQANGKFIKFLFQDDLLLPDCIEKMLSLFNKDKEIGLVFSKRKIISEKSDEKWIKKHKNLHLKWKNLYTVNEGKKLLQDISILSNPLNKIGEPSVVMFKKEVYNKIGPFRSDLVQKLDYEFWFRVMKHYKIGFLDQELSCFRFHEMQATGGYRKNFKQKRVEEKHFYNILYDEVFNYLHPAVKIKLLIQRLIYNLFI